MVVPKKPAATPGLNSRTNSAQHVTKSTKGKERSSLAAGSSSQLSPQSTSGTSTAPSSSSSHSKPGLKKKKSSKKHKSEHVGPSLFDRLVLLLISAFVVYSLSVCPTDHRLQDPVCYSLAQYRAQVLEPYVLPPLTRALSHPTVKPYVEKAATIQQRAVPYVATVDSHTRPYVRKLRKLVWDGAVVPIYQKHVVPAYYQRVHPYVRALNVKADPYVSPIYNRVLFVASKTSDVVARSYSTSKPYMQKAYAFTKPYAIQIYEILRPRIIKAYETFKYYSLEAYEASKPHVQKAYAHAAERVGRALVELGLMKKEYVDKHVGQIWEKVVELSGNEVTSASMAASRSSSSISGSLVETVAESLTSVTTQTALENEPKADITSTEEDVKPPSTTPEVEDTPSATAILSTEAESESSFISTLSSAASVVAKSASSSATSIFEAIESSASQAVFTSLTDDISQTMISPVSSIIAESSDIPTSSSSVATHTDTSQEILSSASSIISESSSDPSSTLIQDPVQSSPPISEEPEDDLDDFLSELGLNEKAEPEPPAPAEEVEEETPVASSMSPEESKALRKQQTAEKRARITKRHEEWFEKIDELVTKTTVEVRTLLDSVRTAGAKSLYDKSTANEGDVSEEYKSLSDKDRDTVLLVDGERVSGLMDTLSNEAEKMLKGLESYLKKEQKAVKDSREGESDLDARKNRWAKVLTKVEEKFSASVQEVQNKVRKWFVAVRDIEIRECLAMSDKVKALADKAQANLGLDYAWLDDVSYKDWQRYHDLMRRHRAFDEQVRMLQNGTHPEPPADPIVSALNQLQLELNDLVTGWSGRARSLNSKAVHEIFSLPSESQPSGEPEVSILPIYTSSPSAGEFDASNVIIGKDKVQIEEALKDIPLETPSESVATETSRAEESEALHEEL